MQLADYQLYEPDHLSGRWRIIESGNLRLGSQPNGMLLTVIVNAKLHRFPMFWEIGINNKLSSFQLEASKAENCSLPHSTCRRCMDAISDISFGIFQIDTAYK